MLKFLQDLLLLVIVNTSFNCLSWLRTKNVPWRLNKLYLVNRFTLGQLWRLNQPADVRTCEIQFVKSVLTRKPWLDESFRLRGGLASLRLRRKLGEVLSVSASRRSHGLPETRENGVIEFLRFRGKALQGNCGSCGRSNARLKFMSQAWVIILNIRYPWTNRGH